MLTVFACVLLVSSIGVVAQELPTAPRLREATRVATTGGQVVACAFDRAGARMLTLGNGNDLSLWRLDELESVARCRLDALEGNAAGSSVVRIALHPELALAMATTDGGADANGAGLWWVDLQAGAVRRVRDGRVDAMAFDASGANFAMMVRAGGRVLIELRRTAQPELAGPSFAVEGTTWAEIAFVDGAVEVAAARRMRANMRVPIDGSKPREVAARPLPVGGASCRRFLVQRDAVTPNVTARLRGQQVQLARPAPGAFALQDRAVGRLMGLWAGPTGVLVVADRGGQLLVCGPAAGAVRVVPARHLGGATRLCWSRDGAFLAVASPLGLRVFDAGGELRCERSRGPGAVGRGGDASQFVWIDADGVWRVGADSAEPELLTSLGARAADVRAALVADVATMPGHVVGVGADIVLATPGGVFQIDAGGDATPLPRTEHATSLQAELCGAAGADAAFVGWRMGRVTPAAMQAWQAERGVQVVGADGGAARAAVSRGGFAWLVPDPGGDGVLAGFDEGRRIVRLDERGAEVGDAVAVTTPVYMLTAVAAPFALVGLEGRLSWLNLATGAGEPTSLPGVVMPPVHGVASKNGSKLAVVAGVEVVAFDVE